MYTEQKRKRESKAVKILKNNMRQKKRAALLKNSNHFMCRNFLYYFFSFAFAGIYYLLLRVFCEDERVLECKSKRREKKNSIK